jgi:hypothetical protein
MPVGSDLCVGGVREPILTGAPNRWRLFCVWGLVGEDRGRISPQVHLV